MRNILLKFLDKLMGSLLKARHKLLKDYADPAAAEFLANWKKAYPSTFDLSKAVAPLNPVTVDLRAAIEKDVPKTEAFPFGGKSNNLVEGPDNPTRAGLISDKTLDEIFPPQESVNYDGH
jgi:hypothetical protein